MANAAADSTVRGTSTTTNRYSLGMANCSGTRTEVGSSSPPISRRVKDGSRRYSRSKRSPTIGSTTAAAKPATEVATPRPNVPRPNSSSRNRLD